MSQFGFKILHQDKQFKARVGEITTAHGIIETPAFVPVGTQATVKSLTPDELDKLGVELFIVNTYHAYLRPGVEIIAKAGGLHKFMNWQKPLITDSGGFQVFSLARKKYKSNYSSSESDVKSDESRSNYTSSSKVSPRLPARQMLLHQANAGGRSDDTNLEIQPTLVKITDEGVKFQSHWDGSKHFFTPEKSIEIQHKLGADIMIAFDECAPFPTTHEYAKKAMERTHEWAKRSLIKHRFLCHSESDEYRARNPLRNSTTLNKGILTSSRPASGLLRMTKSLPVLYGVVQGSIFADLRKESAEVIGQMDFDGIAIGGVSVGESKRQMRQVCDLVIPRLPNDKPRHLLGVGEIDDIFDIIERGVDTFDCVQPTRLARMGHLFASSKFKVSFDPAQDGQSSKFSLDINKKEFAQDLAPIDKNCSCYTCQNFTRAYLHHLFRVRELLGYRLATIHNLHFVLTLVGAIRHHIKAGSFSKFKRNYFKS